MFSSEINLIDLCSTVYGNFAKSDIDLHVRRLAPIKKDKSLSFGVAVPENNLIAYNDLFCGAGGLSIGFEEEGFQLKTAADFDQASIDTFNFNRNRASNPHAICLDLSEEANLSKIPKAPLTIGGPPCQGFSNANRQRQEFDKRNKLYTSFLKAADIAESKFLLIENVPGILKIKDEILTTLKHHGYKATPHLFDSADFGGPQRRKRAFWVAIRTNSSIHEGKFQRYFSERMAKELEASQPFLLSNALRNIPSLAAKNVPNSTALENDNFGYSISKYPSRQNSYLRKINKGAISPFLFNHRSKFNNDRDIEIYRTLKPGDDSTSASINHLNPYLNRANIFKDKFFRLREDARSKTITAHMYYDCHMYIHPNQARGLTPREAARIQGFPDYYIFLGKPNEWYRQIGNAVSPIMSRTIAQALSDAIIKQ